MRPYWLLTVPLGLISLTIGFDARFWPSDDVPLPRSPAKYAPENLVRCRCFRLPGEDWLNLGLPPDVVRIRFLANAAFEPGVQKTLQEGMRPTDFPMKIEYEVRDDEENRLLKGECLFRGRIQGRFDEKSKRPLVGGFYNGSKLLPGISHEFTLSLDKYEGRAKRVLIRLGTHSAKIREVVLRSYALIGTEDQLDKHLWERKSPTWRERLTRANVYPPELVPESERRDLLRHRWSALPPEGIDGQDYQERILCLFRDFQLPPNDPPVTRWEGHPVGPGWKGSIPLPDPPGQVRMVFHWRGQADAPPGHSNSAKVTWHAPDSQTTQCFKATPGGADTVLEVPTGGGLLEIESALVADVRAYWRPQGETEEIEITPEPVVRKSYRVDPQNPVEFSISHLAGEATPLRLILQKIAIPMSPTSAGIPALDWEFLSNEGDVLYSGVIEHAAPLSEFDRLEERQPEPNLAESATRFFSVPAEVGTVRFRSREHSILVSTATRPPDLPYVRVIRNEFVNPAEKETERIWFPLIPNRSAELAEQGRALAVFTRPAPEPAASSPPEQKVWDSFKPDIPWTARRLLDPWQPREEIPPELVPLVFQELKPGLKYKARFPARRGVRQVSPRLVWSGATKIPQTLNVFVDGRLHEKTRVLSQHGRLTLAPLATAGGIEHQIEIRADEEFPLFLSGLEPGLGPTRLERFALRWTSPELTFDYEKLSEGEELLQMKLFQTASADSGSDVYCELENREPRDIGPFEQWTLCRRIFRLEPMEETQTMVLDAAGERVESGQLCVIPLGTDLPPGRHRFTIRRKSGNVGYLLLFRAKLDDGPQHDIDLLTEIIPES